MRFALLSVVLWLWAIRLTANWVYSWPGLHHEDWRYPMLREKNPTVELPVDLMAIHVFPTLQVFAAMLPVYAVTRSERAWGWLDVVALVVGVGAVLLQLVADTQQHRFARTKQPGESLVTGLWAWSRHPNYLGEILMWFSLLLFGLSALPGAWWWQVIGVVGMTAMFLGASIPMMEQRSLERRPGYQDVIDRTVDLAGETAVKAGVTVYEKVDQLVVDGAVNASGSASSATGEELRKINSGKVQNYAAILFAAATVLAGVLIVIV